MGKSKRDEIADGKDDGYEFKLPEFDEKAFVRREVLSARAAFVAVGIGAVAGVVSALVWFALPRAYWWLGFLPILGAAFGLRRVLAGLGYPEDVTAFRAAFGSMTMVFFTGLAVWILGVNLPF
jgi:hypothetical protein